MEIQEAMKQQEENKKPYTIDSAGGQCPVQIEGHINDDGNYFYFRSRGEHWTFDVAKSEKEYWQKNNPIFSVWAQFGAWPDAGWMEHEQAEKIVEMCVNLYLAGKRGAEEK